MASRRLATIKALAILNVRIMPPPVAVISPPRKKKILLVSAGNYFLERVLRQDSSHLFEVVKALPGQSHITGGSAEFQSFACKLDAVLEVIHPARISVIQQ